MQNPRLTPASTSQVVVPIFCVDCRTGGNAPAGNTLRPFFCPLKKQINWCCFQCVVNMLHVRFPDLQHSCHCTEPNLKKLYDAFGYRFDCLKCKRVKLPNESKEILDLQVASRNCRIAEATGKYAQSMPLSLAGSGALMDGSNDGLQLFEWDIFDQYGNWRYKPMDLQYLGVTTQVSSSAGLGQGSSLTNQPSEIPHTQSALTGWIPEISNSGFAPEGWGTLWDCNSTQIFGSSNVPNPVDGESSWQQFATFPMPTVQPNQSGPVFGPIAGSPQGELTVGGTGPLKQAPRRQRCQQSAENHSGESCACDFGLPECGKCSANRGSSETDDSSN
ncbi:hypothetical protein BJ508DRAFT_138611 [Ascobolus immersus RN42]|uniref:Uncharacterized protein n=1 Tax=Ascobolus immersus RN42 TaxID=1160509 RepID=A0A3N4I2H5_ASCIM|nr:hypothetical protein BJ508DRAFT_138611 [Ascobolus immersus RN42]